MTTTMTTTFRRTLATLALVVAAPLGLTAAGPPSYAAEPTPVAGYRHVTWLTEYGSYSIDAPRGWRVTRPGEHSGRVTSPDGSLRLSLAELDGTATVAAALADRVASVKEIDAELLGTGRRTLSPTTGGYAGGTLWLGSLAYRWRDTPETARLVLTRYIGLDLQQGGGPTAIYEVTVSGPADSGRTLRALLRRVTPSVFSTP